MWNRITKTGNAFAIKTAPFEASFGKQELTSRSNGEAPVASKINERQLPLREY